MAELFADASAIVAILAKEEGYLELWKGLKAHRTRWTSPIAVFEATLALRRLTKDSFASEVSEQLNRFLKAANFKILPIDEKIAAAALLACDSYGKGRGHRARLNMGDCFSYACAKSRKIPMLYKGDDFSHTDIKSASVRGKSPTV